MNMSRLFTGLGDCFHRLGRYSRSRKRERYEETKPWKLVWDAKISVLFLGPLLQVILWSPRDKLSLQSPSFLTCSGFLTGWAFLTFQQLTQARGNSFLFFLYWTNYPQSYPNNLLNFSFLSYSLFLLQKYPVISPDFNFILHSHQLNMSLNTLPENDCHFATHKH